MFRRPSALFALCLCLASLVSRPATADAPAGKPAALAATDEDKKADDEIERLADLGKYDEALAAAERLVSMREQKYGKEDPRTASALSDVGALRLAKGNPPAAELSIRRAVEILEKAKGADDRLSPALQNLGYLLLHKGDARGAEAAFTRAVEIEEKAGAARQSELGSALRNLAKVYVSSRRDKAVKLVERAVTLHDKPGSERPLIGDLVQLAVLKRLDGRHDFAQQHYLRALSLSERVNGPEHPSTGELLLEIAIDITAGVLLAEDRPKAEPYFRRAEAILEKALGPDHPNLAHLHEEWAGYYMRIADRKAAIAQWEKALAIQEKYLENVIASCPEEDRLAYARQLERTIDRVVSFQMNTGTEYKAITRLVLQTILRHKGRVLDATAAGLSALRGRMNEGDRHLLDDLVKTRGKLATLIVEGPRGRTVGELIEQSKALGDEADRIEAKIAERSAEFRLARAPITIEAVQARIPKDAALVELVRYQNRRAGAYSELGETHELGETYMAYVLRSEGEPMVHQLSVSGGEMDRKAKIIRTASQDPKNFDFQQQLGLLHHVMFTPFVGSLPGVRHLIISPDSTISVIPLATAVSHEQRFLIEDYVLTYVSSGRDLLRFGDDRPSARSGPVVFANPDYDAPGEPGKTMAKPIAKGALPTLSRLRFAPLPGTAEEAAAIRKILPAPAVRLQDAASETDLLRVTGPKILHVATHGFFLNEEGVPQKGSKRGFELDTSAPPGEPADDGRRVRVVNPMFRSAIALAGANVRKGQADDGILTAYEVSALDLSGTELVVLSACETGLGSLVAREGVQGLRRALVIAGAETQVMSLWQVDDLATRDLMVSYYDKLFRKGMGRGEAMREAQVEMLHTKGREHPFYWASFIVSGAWGPLAGIEPGAGESEEKPKAAGQAVVPPGGARGCGCFAAGRGPSERTGAALLMLVALLATRRSRRPRTIC